MKGAGKMNTAYVVGTADTKGPELRYVRDLLQTAGIDTVLVNVGTKGGEQYADVPAAEVAACHPDGPAAVFVNDRGRAVIEMARALTEFATTREDLGGIIGLGGSGGSGIIAPAMQALPIGLPKVLVSTLASGDVSAYVGASDVNMFHPVTDVSGLNRVSRKLLGNAAHALAGMMAHHVPEAEADKPAVVLSMFGVTTPAVQAITGQLSDTYDCLVFHATGSGGRSMEQIIDQGDVAGVLDITTTEVCDLLVGGVLSAGEDRLGAVAARGGLLSAPAGRSTWPISGGRRPCRRSSRAASSITTTRRLRSCAPPPRRARPSAAGSAAS